MNADRERALLARAHQLADVEDLAEEVTAILGRARGSRLDPDALTHLAAAARILGAGSLTLYRASGPPYADDRDYAAAVEDTESEINALAAVVAHARTEAKTAADDAYAALRAARDALDAARAMPVCRPCDGCHQARAAAIETARADIAAAQDRIAYAEQAAAVLGELAERLAWAKTRIVRVLPDLGEVYEPVYEHVGVGRLMPKDGDWLTGADPGALPGPVR